jgi:hypothetical protein
MDKFPQNTCYPTAVERFVRIIHLLQADKETLQRRVHQLEKAQARYAANLRNVKDSVAELKALCGLAVGGSLILGFIAFVLAFTGG